MIRGPRHSRRYLPAGLLALACCLPGTGLAGSPPPAHKPESPVNLVIVTGDPSATGDLSFEVRVHAERPLEDLQLEISAPGPGAPGRGPQRLAEKLPARGELSRTFRATVPAAGVSEIVARVNFRLPGGGRLSRAAYVQFQDGRRAHASAPKLTQDGADTLGEYPAGGIR